MNILTSTYIGFHFLVIKVIYLYFRVYHGTRLLREAHSTPYSAPEHSSTRLHKMVSFNSWVDIKSLVILNVPLEVILQLKTKQKKILKTVKVKEEFLFDSKGYS